MKTLQPRGGIYAERVADIVDAAARIVQADGRFALITSLSIEGGAAHEVGSLAIVKPDGKMTGYLSNGCIDRDIQHRSWHWKPIAKKWSASVRGLAGISP
ncbi:XdhC family protein [Ruegeria pomeroyi]|jgi:xanthine dehydrogenase accessory factor|uniref:XdhC family protein n=1 Tax=Ruegeria pomeroyi TaxID=89184 RepID=A0A850LM17_9RHOB|nr:XdhC family protein [Ruegeria pomeroyi]NVL02804.1 XdhC family protein [Ruegeria pomeroyi]QWV09244.1 XdhC family protein [Ruegeria pomeroyi]HCE70114.1 XdhC family protein [Ruegeria sp.]